MTPPDSQVLFGRYRTEQQLATGGMGELYLARDTTLDRWVVIKDLRRELHQDKRIARMFMDEARALARIDHPHICRIFDLGEADGRQFMVLEWVQGWDLWRVHNRLFRERTRMPIPIAVQLILDACAGLHAAHAATTTEGQPLNLVHRDIKPRNLMVTTGGLLKVLDFGVAKTAVQAERTQTGLVKGTLSYFSPEQCLGAPVDRRSDLFSLGTVLHELLCCRPLFQRSGVGDVVAAILRDPIEPPLRPGEPTPEALVAIVMRALHRDPARRFADAAAMGRALEQVIPAQDLPGREQIAAYFATLFPDDPRGDQPQAEPLRPQDSTADAQEVSAASAPPSEVSAVTVPSTPAPVPQPEPTVRARVAVAELSAEPPTLRRERVVTPVTTERLTPPLVEPTPRVEPDLHVRPTLRLEPPLLSETTERVAQEAAREPPESDLHVRRTLRLDRPPPQETTERSAQQVTVEVTRRIEPQRPAAGLAQPAAAEPSLAAAALVRRPAWTLFGLVGLAAGLVTLLWWWNGQASPGDAAAAVDGTAVAGFYVEADAGTQAVPATQRVRAQDAATADAATGRLAGDASSSDAASIHSARDAGRASARSQRRRTGRLTLDAVPWAYVDIDGRRIGPTPVVNVELPAGRVRVHLHNPELGLERTVEIPIVAGRSVRRQIALDGP
ncbi:MAG: protein kinase [Pseudomonadota bacterium]